MKSTDLEKAHAVKLSEILGGLGFDLKPADSLAIVSKLEGYSDRKANTSIVSEEQQIAEQIMGEMLDAISELNYKKFTKRMDKEVLETFTEKQFLRSMRNLSEDLGPYVRRKYLGTVNGGHYSVPVDKYPEKKRHIWRGVYENFETFITLGIYIKNGVPQVRGFNFR